MDVNRSMYIYTQEQREYGGETPSPLLVNYGQDIYTYIWSELQWENISKKAQVLEVLRSF